MGNEVAKVAITGIGLVTPLGLDKQSTWQNLLAQKSAVDTIRRFDASGFPVHIGAEVKDFVLRIKPLQKWLRSSIRCSRFALNACEEALQDANIRPTKVNAARWGLIAGSGMINAEYEFWKDFQNKYAKSGDIEINDLGKSGLSSISASQFASMQTNHGVGLIAKQYGIRGYTCSVHTACASGGQALGLGMRIIRRGQADFVLAGGYDSMLNPIGLTAFCLLGALSTYNDTPKTASRPFDLTRKGFVLGEGSGFLVLERLDHAKARGAKIYAELAGEGNSLSSYRITDSHPSGDGAIQAIQGALKDAKVTVDQVDYINAHGTSTKMNDLSETNAIKTVFGSYAKQIPVSSNKSQIGHLISSAGAVEAAITALTIAEGKIPMTCHLTKPDPECDLDYVTEEPRRKNVAVALSNSFGFGGTNSTLVFKQVD